MDIKIFWFRFNIDIPTEEISIIITATLMDSLFLTQRHKSILY